jgi:hypothetical protein
MISILFNQFPRYLQDTSNSQLPGNEFSEDVIDCEKLGSIIIMFFLL